TRRSSSPLELRAGSRSHAAPGRRSAGFFARRSSRRGGSADGLSRSGSDRPFEFSAAKSNRSKGAAQPYSAGHRRVRDQLACHNRNPAQLYSRTIFTSSRNSTQGNRTMTAHELLSQLRAKGVELKS